jgi:hypothetical protein
MVVTNTGKPSVMYYLVRTRSPSADAMLTAIVRVRRRDREADIETAMRSRGVGERRAERSRPRGRMRITWAGPRRSCFRGTGVSAVAEDASPLSSRAYRRRT